MKQPNKDLTGSRFGITVVLKYAGVKPVIGKKFVLDQHHWLVKCDCGQTLEMSHSRLTTIKRPCCGSPACSPRSLPALPLPRPREGRKLQPGYGNKTNIKRVVEILLTSYRRGAANRGLEWSLTRDEFFQLITSPCHYSGLPPSKSKITKDGYFYWNGIDRVDNSKGYIPGNVVPCCTFANTAKMDRPYDEFVAWLDQVAAFRTEQKTIEQLFED